MSRLKNYAAVWLAVIMIGVYLIFYVYTDYIISKFVADLLALIGLGFMSASTTPVAYRAFVNGITTDRDKFIFSYWLIWTLALIHRIWITILGLTGNPDWLHFSAVSGLLGVMFTIASAYGGLAPVSGDHPLQRHEIIIFSVAAGFSGLIAGIAIGVFFVSGWAN